MGGTATPYPTRVLVLSFVVVAISTIPFPWVTGYGTNLFQIVALAAWALLAKFSSEEYADLHHAPLWTLALILNLILFAVPATLLWLPSRTRWPRASACMVATWCVFYVACLYVLFPATDGP